MAASIFFCRARPGTTNVCGPLRNWIVNRSHGDITFQNLHDFQYHQARGVRTKPKLSVILTSQVERLGRPGDIVQVPAGYARNKLVPQKTALPAIHKYIELVKREKVGQSASEKQESDVEPVAVAKSSTFISVEERLKEAEEIARRLDSKTLSVRRNVVKRTSTLQQPITKEHILGEVGRQYNIKLEDLNVVMASAITSVGEHNIALKFPTKVDLPGEKEQIYLKLKVRRK